MGVSTRFINGAHQGRYWTLMRALVSGGYAEDARDVSDEHLMITYTADLTWEGVRDGALSPEAYLRWKAER